MREQILTTAFIRNLARYFKDEFVDESIEDDRACNPLVYALEACDQINESIENNRRAIKDYEYLTSLKTYEEFKKSFEELDFIDIVITLFEAR